MFAESDLNSPLSLRTCPACGAAARRVEARFCSTCGRALEGGYLPADALRASYHQHRQRAAARRRAMRVQPMQPIPSVRITPNRNRASRTALAFVTYSLVPYLGIFFCPGAVLMGGVGLIRSFRAPQHGGRRASYAGIVVGIVVLCAQILLWWILYKVPQWAQK